MISTTDFVHRHGSFWKTHFPAMENYVRIVNSGGYQRYCNEMQWKISSNRSYLISEVAFCLFKSKKITPENISKAFDDAIVRLSGLPGTPEAIDPLEQLEKLAAIELAGRLRDMCNLIADGRQTIIDPEFPGCGALSRSRGDIIAGDVLLEVKAVDRPFRASDFRQTIIYALQNLADGKSNIVKIGLLNPRRGIYYIENFDQIIFDISGASIYESQSAFLSAVGMGGVSR